MKSKKNYLIQKIIANYDFIFEENHINDSINLILLCTALNVEIPFRKEEQILSKIREEENPINWAVYLLYSQYDSEYYESVKREIEENIINKIEAIRGCNDICIYREFWWVLIFNKCPFLSSHIKEEINKIIDSAYSKKFNDNSNADEIVSFLVGDFLKNNDKQFFEWDILSVNLLKEITFKTLKRTLFKSNNFNNILYEFSSID